ncbi:recombination regulator RecX [Periweissella cryptocerci]|uniref:Regulatory protein RecX n=1 Tax=Periweissella cryptocerci TaxID=2506420 RepID=A0A4P6YV44_9LACO|nr:recombination regulator RecX [Periweissella cryptocerci]QBO36621.1 recombination regulator RecX [Periweissella cryptocerci]
MGVITKVEVQKRGGRYNIYLDGKYAFPAAESVLLKYNLFKGSEVDKELQAKIKRDDDIAMAYSKAIDYLSGFLRSTKAVHDKLVGFEIPEDVIEMTIERLKEYKLLDDLAYAQSYVHTQAATSDKGPFVISQKLRQSGISANDIEEAMLDYSIEDQVENATKLANKLVKRYHRESGFQRQQKVYQGLSTKGFGGEVITQVQEVLKGEPEDPDDELDNLREMAAKLWARNRRYEGNERVQRTKRNLYAKGFDGDAISTVVNQLMEENTD